MEIVTKQVEMNQVERNILDQFVLDEDYNVPDSKSDVEKIIASKGQIHIDEVKPVENYLRVQGKVEFQVLYIAEGFEPTFSCLEGKLPFIEMVYAEDGADKTPILKTARLELNVHMIHSRKLRLKAMVELELEFENQILEEIPIDVVCDCKMQKKYQDIDLLQLHTSKRDTYRIKEEIGLAGTKESIGTILWSDVGNRRFDTRLAVDELQITGELSVFCFYESPDGKLDWVEQIVPYQGRVSCHNVDESMFHHVRADLEEIHVEARVDEDGEMRIIGVEGTLQLHLVIYEEEQTEVLEDMYSVERTLIPETREVAYEQLVLQNHSKCKVMERLSVPELQNEILQICHSSGSVRVDDMKMTEDGVRIEGVLYIRFLYVRANDNTPFDTWQGVVPFTHLIECNQTGNDIQYLISGLMEQLNITLQGGDEIEVKAVLAFKGFFKRVGKMELIQSIAMQELDLEEVEKRPSVVGYIVKEGDDLWSLAKRYSTTKEAICEVNELTEGNLKTGDRILIFKENMSIL